MKMPKRKFSPIFVIGVPRSGTMLLRILLDSHSEIAGAPETSWLAGGYGRLSLREFIDYLCNGEIGPVKNLTGVTPVVIKSAGREFLKIILKQYISKRQRKYLVLKTPDDIGYLEFILELFPDSKYIHIYRDGRDVACSTFAQKNKYFGDDVRKEYGELTILNSLRRWHEWEIKLRKLLDQGDSKYINVGYEQLVNEPTKVLKQMRVCQT